MVKSARRLDSYLKKRGYSYTQVRKQVFEVLENKEPQSMYELIIALPQIDRSSVYRTIGLFEKNGVVHRIQMGWKHKFELSDKFAYHHHHMTCMRCSKVITILDAGKIENALNNTARTHGFTPITHQIEIQGFCKYCQLK